MLINIFLLIIKTTEEEKRIKDEDFIEKIREELIEKKIVVKEIELDFEKMEEIFNNMFDKIIDEYFINIPSAIEMDETVKINVRGLPNVFYYHNDLIYTIIRNIFLRDFLDFYDEYSYRINYKFHFINTFRQSPKLMFFKKSTSLPLINKQNIEINNNITINKYLDLYYFLEKLEHKINEKYKISNKMIRRILYGKPFEDIKDINISCFYSEIHEIRKYPSFDELINYNEEAITHSFNNKLLEEYSKDYGTDIKKLYKYHLNTNPITEEDTIRFDFLEQFIKKYYGGFKELYKNELKNTIIPKTKCFDDMIEEVRSECFRYILYYEIDKDYFRFNGEFFDNTILKQFINIYNGIN